MSGLVIDTITGEVVGHPEVAAPVRFVYDPADPYAVLIDLTALRTEASEGDEPVTWTFARQILVPGNAPDLDSADAQDVRAWRDGAWLVIHLASPDGSGEFRFLAQVVARFVHRTQVAVPLGRESRHVAAAVDDAVEQLLRGVR